MNKIGTISFLLAMIVALLVTFGVSIIDDYLWIMAIFGAAFAIFSLDDKEMNAIILALGLSMAAGSLNDIPAIGNYISAFAGQMAMFMSAAALVIALRWLWNMGNVMGLMK